MNAPQDFRAMTADSIGKDLLSALVTEVKLMPDTWPKLSQKRQDDIDEAFEDGYQAAADGQPESACPVMPGKLCIKWVKGWKKFHEINPEG